MPIKGAAAMIKGAPRSPIQKQLFRLNTINGTLSRAFKFGPDVKKIQLNILHKRTYGPTVGIIKFWRMWLPILKFHNDDTDFVVTRFKANTKEELSNVKTTITVHNSNGTSDVINCANRHTDEIIENLVKYTKATEIPKDEIPVFGKEAKF